MSGRSVSRVGQGDGQSVRNHPRAGRIGNFARDRANSTPAASNGRLRRENEDGRSESAEKRFFAVDCLGATNWHNRARVS